MAAPSIEFSVTGNKISSVVGFDKITVSFTANEPY